MHNAMELNAAIQAAQGKEGLPLIGCFMVFMAVVAYIINI